MIARSAMVALTLLAGLPAPGPDSDAEAKLSVDVREGDLRRLLAALAEVGGVQIVADPDVSCRLTLKVEAMAWRDVLSQVLRACGLGAEGGGALLRVAPVDRLASEARERRELARVRGETLPRVSTRTLSYARAEEVAPLVRTLMGPDAEVVYDRRTNTLIIVERR